MIKIYVPKHLRNLEIVDQMCRMIDEYVSRGNQDSEEDSFSDYNSYLSSDPVLEFIDYIYPESDNREDKIMYLTNYFYCLKGTREVIDSMSKYLPLEVEGTYSVSSLTLRIVPSGITVDQTRFRELLNEFLRSLLYFGEIQSEAASVPLDIDSTIEKIVYVYELTSWKEYKL